MTLKIVDLFCGAGGFSEGFRQAGFDIILGVDNWDIALQTFEHNHFCKSTKLDVRDIHSLPKCDVIIGSPPCQSFSNANQYQKKVDLSCM